MLKNNRTKLNLIYILIVLLIMVIVPISGMIFVKTSVYKEAKITEKEIIEDKNIENSYAIFSDNLSLQIVEPTYKEKISSRASNSRRQRGVDNYISIEEVSISRDMDLTVRTGLSKQDFVTLISNVSADTSGFFEENAEYIYDLCEIYNINEIFFCGLISAESGWNIASNHRTSHNYISLMSSSGGLIRFDTVESGLEEAAKVLHNNYLTPGGRFYRGNTLEAVRTRFCPVNPGWTSLVFGRMSQII